MTIPLNLHLGFKFIKPFILLSVRNNKCQGAQSHSVWDLPSWGVGTALRKCIPDPGVCTQQPAAPP